MTEHPTPRELVDQRESIYQGAWKLHGQVLRPLALKLGELHINHPDKYFPWMMIFNKLLRIIASPAKRDHWLDIQGYAQLVLDEMDRQDEEQHPEPDSK